MSGISACRIVSVILQDRDRATMTMYFVRHGNLLTIRAVMDDPVYFSEPLVRSRVWALDPRGAINLGNGVAAPCEPISEPPRADAAGRRAVHR